MPSGVAERLRTLRKHAGLTQTELAGERFSKEYVSQIELGKTSPSAEAIEYLAERLDVDPLFLETGVSSDERGRIEATLARGEALIEDKRYADAVEEYVEEQRNLVMQRGRPGARVPRADRRGDGHGCESVSSSSRSRCSPARATSRERPRFSDIERADVLFRMGVCRYRMTSVQTAIALLTEALELANEVGTSK